LSDIAHYIRELDKEFSLQSVAFDPRFFEVVARELEGEGIPMSEVPQSNERMTIAVGETYARIMGGRLTHDGDPTFNAHMLGGVPRFNLNGFTVVKGRPDEAIDACDSTCMAVYRITRDEPAWEPMVAYR
jgi:phage terminase large subunit-like protein